ncbi:type II toxin-antitoxin system PemK/MazF family toxin [Nitriliruptoria bacterium AS10]|nr:type II toxin-antitoxin system PemK/MazF family toxin [Salsipaludibacter albus]
MGRDSRPTNRKDGAGIDLPDLATVDDVRGTRRDRTARPGDDAGPSTIRARDERRRRSDDDGVHSPGQLGPSATTEVDPRDLDLVHTAYSPDTDGDPDPGEVVWTWVPYEERDGRGKDRPVLVVARMDDDTVLALQLSSRDREGQRDWLPLGAGAWDGEHRPSWVALDRVFLVHPDGMRREAATLDRDRFDRVTHALAGRYRWPE